MLSVCDLKRFGSIRSTGTRLNLVFYMSGVLSFENFCLNNLVIIRSQYVHVSNRKSHSLNIKCAAQIQQKVVCGNKKLELIKNERSIMKLVSMFYIFLCIRKGIQQNDGEVRRITFAENNLQFFILPFQELRSYREADEQCKIYQKDYHIAFELRKANVREQIVNNIILDSGINQCSAAGRNMRCCCS